jgi:4-amino-4-deoxy-L-arabinose transferase-like glycosyltransferase
MPTTTQRKKFIFFLILTLIVRILFSSFVGLIDDEAYHWSWTKDLMLSYYDHPGMIAWLETLSTHFLGDTLWGVRLPSFLLYWGTIGILWKLTQELFNERAAWMLLFLFLWSPFYGFGGYVASPEAPFIFFWALGAWVFWQGMKVDSKPWSTAKTWLTLGLIMGLGLNSKFITALLAPGFGLFLLTTEKRKSLLTRWPYYGILIATLICLPIFIWNIEYKWPGFYYQFYDRHTGREFSSNRWLVWLGAQFLFYTPVIFGLFITAIVTGFRRFQSSLQWKFILCLALPSLVMFYPQPLWADYKPHWPGAAHMILLIGVCGLLVQWQETKPKLAKILMIGILAFYIPMNLLTYTPFLGPWLPKVARVFNPDVKWELKWDMSNEFYGWKELGQELNEMQKNYHRDNGLKPFLAALRYETTAQTFWGASQKTYMLSSPKSHYTVVQKHRGTLTGFLGQPALVVTTEKYPSDPRNYARWDTCEPREFKTYRSFFGTPELSRIFTIWTCTNFQGLLKE